MTTPVTTSKPTSADLASVYLTALDGLLPDNTQPHVRICPSGDHTSIVIANEAFFPLDPDDPGFTQLVSVIDASMLPDHTAGIHGICADLTADRKLVSAFLDNDGDLLLTTDSIAGPHDQIPDPDHLAHTVLPRVLASHMNALQHLLNILLLIRTIDHDLDTE